MRHKGGRGRAGLAVSRRGSRGCLGRRPSLLLLRQLLRVTLLGGRDLGQCVDELRCWPVRLSGWQILLLSLCMVRVVGLLLPAFGALPSQRLLVHLLNQLITRLLHGLSIRVGVEVLLVLVGVGRELAACGRWLVRRQGVALRCCSGVLTSRCLSVGAGCLFGWLSGLGHVDE